MTKWTNNGKQLGICDKPPKNHDHPLARKGVRVIELRWFYDPLSDAHRVLQYRTLLIEVRAEWHDDDIGGRVVPVDWRGQESSAACWSDWTDIPEISAADL